MVSDIAFTHGAEERIRDCVREDVSIGVSIKAAIMRDLHATEDQFSTLCQAVDVITNS
jgi:hypothetical protein